MAVNKLIDHTLLKATATPEQIKKLCLEAKQYDFMSVCVNTCYVSLAKECLKGSDVKVCTVIGFPLGAMSTKSKVCETTNAIHDGADEIDMVINVGMLQAKEDKYVEKEIHDIKKACKGRLLKVILETCLLSDEEITRACQLAMSAGADFVKTSTGFSTAGATKEAVALMRKTVGDKLGVKASGGIKTLKDLEVMVEAGATRIGTSNGVTIIEEDLG
ncbi:MAG: deoxyribose-phosphate aldolase [Coprobacillus sp.]|nr:deoxyribose-phosphate aldolase [Coprobacillus sp.]